MPSPIPAHQQNRNRRGGRVWLLSPLVGLALVGLVGGGTEVSLAMAQEATAPLVLHPPKIVLTPPANGAPAENSPNRKRSEFLLPQTPNPTPPAVAQPANPTRGITPAPHNPNRPAVVTTAPPKRSPVPPVLLATVSFARNQTTVTDRAANSLQPVVARMKARPSVRATLYGYTNDHETDTNRSNIPVQSDLLRQSLAQAQAVRAWLVGAGIARERIDLAPKGASPTTNTANRVEVVLQP
ncbi:MAG: hypothetical protein ORO03_04140 [Alphaproteobacteria bacterium]|nr:hypothetical protein [Alphaproteobacteria bacterium]